MNGYQFIARETVYKKCNILFLRYGIQQKLLSENEKLTTFRFRYKQKVFSIACKHIRMLSECRVEETQVRDQRRNMQVLGIQKVLAKWMCHCIGH